LLVQEHADRAGDEHGRHQTKKDMQPGILPEHLEALQECSGYARGVPRYEVYRDESRREAEQQDIGTVFFLCHG